MTISNSPVAEINLDNDINTAESIEIRISNLNELINSIEIIYANNQFRMASLEQPLAKNLSLNKGPWKNSISQGPADNLNANSIWDFIFTSPIKDIYYNASPQIAQNLPNLINNVNRVRYDSIFNEHIERINISGGLKDSITNAVSQLNNLNVIGYQSQLENAKELIVSPLIEELEVFKAILNVVSTEINNPQSTIYKAGSPFGPFSNQEIASFEMPPITQEIITSITSTIEALRRIFNRIDQLVNIPQDVLTRIILINSGLQQSTTDPDQFNFILPNEKEPWGIRFSYQTTQSGNLFATQNQVNEFSNNPTGHSITRLNSNQRQQELEATRELLEDTIINSTRDFYFQLLPAIKTNMPSSGSTDVPGAMPGIQFRIENNIVKHKIPGFAPIYQPIGIDSIKCTLVGMFTGNDGVDLSSSYLDDISVGLLKPGQSSIQDNTGPFNNESFNIYDQSKDSKSFGGSRFSSTIGGLPEVKDKASSTAATIPSLSEDAFRGAQDFYNEIVSQGKEVEVELNLRKGSGPFPGGNIGPFRDPDTGNPRFKGLIKRLDLYYVRRDRCWFIIDLEITESGLIGKECLNLTNVIDESVELFEGVTEPIGLTKEELDKCFKDPHEMPLNGEDSGTTFVLDQATGLSYFYSTLTGSLRSDRTYPLSYDETQRFLYQNRFTGVITNVPRIVFDIANSTAILGGLAPTRVKIAGLMLRLAALYEPTLTSTENDFAVNLIPSSTVKYLGIIGHGTSWKYNKNDGKFYFVFESDGSFVRSIETSTQRARTLKDLLYDREFGFFDLGAVDKIANFVVNEYNPLLKNTAVNCDIQANNPSNNNIVSTSIAEQPSTIIPNTQVNNNNSTVEETTLVNSNNENNNEDELQTIINNIENGLFDEYIQQALNQYFKILSSNNRSFTADNLTPNLNTILKTGVENGTLFIESDNNINITLIEGRSRVTKNQTNNSEISIAVKYNFDKEFTLVSNNTRFNYNPISTNRDADIIVRAVLNNGIRVYKIDAISLATSRTGRNRASSNRVTNASIDAAPSNNNIPVIFNSVNSPPITGNNIIQLPNLLQ